MDAGAIQAIKNMAWDLVMPYAAELFEAELSEGGTAYAMAEQSARMGVDAWYGMYSPKVYQRGMTLSSGITIDHSGVSIDGHSLSASMVVGNTSPHIGWTGGFPMRNGKFRPGGDIYKFLHPAHVSIAVPESICEQCLEQAMRAYYGI